MKGSWCKYSSSCQEGKCSGCYLYLNRNINTGSAGAHHSGSIPLESVAKAGFFQDRLTPNPHPAFANSDLTESSSDGASPPGHFLPGFPQFLSRRPW